MASLRERLKRSKFVRDTLFLQSATAVDFATGFVTLVALARCLGVEGYGTWAQVVRVSELLTLLLSVGLVQATLSRLCVAVANGERERVRELLAFFVKASVYITGFAAVAAALAAPLAARLVFGIKDDGSVGWLAGVLVLALPLGIPSRLVSTVLQGSRRMEELAYYENWASLTRVVLILGALVVAVQLPAGDVRAVVWVVGARLLGTCCNSVCAVALYGRWRRRYAAKARADVDLPPLGEIFRRAPRARMRQDLPFSMWIGLDKNVATLVTLIPFMILGWATDEATQKLATGRFNLAMGLLAFPLTALNAVARNALVKLGEQRGSGDHAGFFRVLRQVTLVSGAYSLLVVGGFTAVSFWVVPLLFGADYVECLPYLWILAVYAAVQGFGTGLGSVFNVYERIGASLLIKVFGVALVLPLGIFWARTLEDAARAVSFYHATQMCVIVALAWLYVGWLRRQPPPAPA